MTVARNPPALGLLPAVKRSALLPDLQQYVSGADSEGTEEEQPEGGGSASAGAVQAHRHTQWLAREAAFNIDKTLQLSVGTAEYS